MPVRPGDDRMVIPAEPAVAVLAVLVGLFTLNTLPVSGADAMYVVLAKALATGQGYHSLNLPGAPEAVHFPPGYPLLLALFWKIAPTFPGNVAWFRALNVLVLGVMAWATCRYTVRVLGFSSGMAVLATLIGTMSIPILTLVAMVAPDPFFLVLLMPALILGEEMARRTPERHAAVWLGVLSGALVLVRSMGIVLPLAVILVWCVRRHRKAAAWYGGAMLLVLAPWLLWTWLHAGDVPRVLQDGYGTYDQWYMQGLHGGLSFLLDTVRTNMHLLIVALAGVFRLGTGLLWTLLAAAALALMLAWGAWSARRRAPVTLVFLALYLALVLVWPTPPRQLVWGVWPVLMCLLLVPLESLGAIALPRWTRTGIALAALVLLAGALRYNGRGFHDNAWGNVPRADVAAAESAARWVRVHAKRTDVIASDAESAMYLYTERQAVPVVTFGAAQYLRAQTAQESGETLRQILSATGARYVLVQSAAALGAARAMAADSTRPPFLSVVDTSTSGLTVFAVTQSRPTP